MTDESDPVEGAATDPSRDRARIEPPAAPKKLDLLPIVYLVGFVVLAGAIYFLWQNPPEARLAAQDAGKVDTLQAQVASLRDAVARLEQQKPPTPGASAADLQQVQQQLAALANKPGSGEGDTQRLQQELAALAARPAATPDQVEQLGRQIQSLPKPPDLAPLVQRIEQVEGRPQFDPASLDPKFGEIATQVGQLGDRLQQLTAKNDDADSKLGQTLQALQSRVDELDRQQKAMAQRAQAAAKLQGVAAALTAGQKLGPIPGAPPALARFANEAPPTEASLRESFDRYAADAQRANQPALTENQGFGSRLWTRAQQSVTVRQGERVLVGDPIAGVVAHAREQLENGDLAGAVQTVKTLNGAALTAMQPWLDKATSLLDARAAIATMVAG